MSAGPDAVIVTPGNTAPVLSATVPLMLPVVPCACACAKVAATTKRTKTARESPIVIPPSASQRVAANGASIRLVRGNSAASCRAGDRAVVRDGAAPVVLGPNGDPNARAPCHLGHAEPIIFD